MLAKVTEFGGSFIIELNPETLQESSTLVRLAMRGNVKAASTEYNFDTHSQTLRTEIPIYKSREYNNSINNTKNKIF